MMRSNFLLATQLHKAPQAKKKKELMYLFKTSFLLLSKLVFCQPAIQAQFWEEKKTAMQIQMRILARNYS